MVFQVEWSIVRIVQFYPIDKGIVLILEACIIVSHDLRDDGGGSATEKHCDEKS